MSASDRWELTDEAKAKIPAWNAVWIDRIMTTEPINFERTKEACRGMLRAAKLPDNPNFARVLSPVMGAVVLAAARVYFATEDATWAATEAATEDATWAATEAATEDATWAATEAATGAATGAATRAATWAATRAATEAATWAATGAATRAATRAATEAATRAATEAATWAATGAATRAATRAATEAATRAATEDATGDAIKIMIDAAAQIVSIKSGRNISNIIVEVKNLVNDWSNFYDGGSDWCAWPNYLSFVRDVIGWKDQSHQNYAHYEAAAVHGGPRFMHRRSILLSNRPVIRKTELIGQTYRLHCDNGPALAWADGIAEWYIHGVRVDRQVVMQPTTQTIQQIQSESNEEVRRVRIERYGWERFLRQAGAKVINSRRNDRDTQTEELYRLDDGTQRFVCVDPSTGRRYALGVPANVKTCEQAQNWMSHGLDLYATHRS